MKFIGFNLKPKIYLMLLQVKNFSSHKWVRKLLKSNCIIIQEWQCMHLYPLNFQFYYTIALDKNIRLTQLCVFISKEISLIMILIKLVCFNWIPFFKTHENHFALEIIYVTQFYTLKKLYCFSYHTVHFS